MGKKFSRNSTLLGFKNRILAFGTSQAGFSILLIFLFLVLGVFLRFYRLKELAMFVGDQGRDYLAAKEILVNRKLIFTGPQTSISWLYLGPFFYYFLAIFLWLGKFDPIWPVYGTAIGGVLAIYLIYLLGKNLFSPKIGLIAASIYAVSPFAVLQSRIALHPSIYPVFVILFLILLHQIFSFQDFSWPRGRWFTLLFNPYSLLLISFFVAIQLHLSAVLLVPIAVLTWEQIKFPSSKRWLNLFLGMTAVLVIFKIFKQSPFTPIAYWWKIFKQIFFFGNEWGAVLALIVVGVGIAKILSQKGKAAKLLKTSLMVIVLGLTIKNSQAEHYFNLFLPIVVLLFSLGAGELISRLGRNVSLVIFGFIFLFINSYTLINKQFFIEIYGPGLKSRIELARFIIQDSNTNNPVLVRCGPLWDFSSTNQNYEYLVWWLGKENKWESKKEAGKTIYYIFEPKEAWKTKEGCPEVNQDQGRIFDFDQARVLRIKG